MYQNDYSLYDNDLPVAEQLPRSGKHEIPELKEGGYHTSLYLLIKRDGEIVHAGKLMEEEIDQKHGATFDEIFSVCFMAILGWSPLMRQKMNRNRLAEVNREDSNLSREVEAKIIIKTQADISRFNTDLREMPDFPTPDAMKIPNSLLKTIKSWTRSYEVETASDQQWEKAIRKSYSIWEKVKRNNGGFLHYNLEKRRVDYELF